MTSEEVGAVQEIQSEAQNAVNYNTLVTIML
jgi:hypothetical protein